MVTRVASKDVRTGLARGSAVHFQFLEGTLLQDVLGSGAKYYYLHSSTTVVILMCNNYFHCIVVLFLDSCNRWGLVQSSGSCIFAQDIP